MSRINIILLGNSGVGKTAILNRFRTGEFKKPKESTIPVELRTKTVSIDGKEFSIFLWDLAGQERFNTVVRSYYRKAEGVLLVYDVTVPETFYCLSEWLCELKDANENAEILIAGNKNDDPYKKVVNVPMVKIFARDENLEYMEISALTGENVVEAFDFLLRKILKAKGILPEKSASSDGLSSLMEVLEKEKVIKLNSCQTTTKSSCC